MDEKENVRAACAWKENVKTSKAKAIEDLTNRLDLFKKLGLEFRADDCGALR